MNASHEYNEAPNIHLIRDDEMRQWVAVCVQARKNGASPDEIARLAKVLKRLVPALSEAAAVPPVGTDFGHALETLGVATYG